MPCSHSPLSRARSGILSASILLLSPTVTFAMDLARVEARVDSAVTLFGVTGKGVLIAILDRGIDWRNADFRKPDGSTRIQGILDFSSGYDGAAAYGGGVIYTRGMIDSANAGLLSPLPTRDAIGHGTTSAGIACGSGRNSPGSKYRGVAPDADLLVIKLTSDGAPAHDAQPAEAAFYDPRVILPAIQYAEDRAAALGEPCVMVLNIGSSGGPTDGTSALDRAIDASVGAGIPGLVIVNGVGDDGGVNNRAGGALAGDDSTSIHLHKGSPNPLVFDMWYDADKLMDIGCVDHTGFVYEPFFAPATNVDWDYQLTPDFTYYQYGANATPWQTTGNKREVYFNFNGPAGDYTITLFNRTAFETAFFTASINPSNYWNPPEDQNFFAGLSRPATLAISPRASTPWSPPTTWSATIGSTSTASRATTTRADRLADLEGKRRRPDVRQPARRGCGRAGNSVFTTYAPTSYWATFRFNEIQGGGGLYGRASAVSAANSFIGGIVALMLQRNTALDAVQVRDILRNSARKDAFTGLVGTNSTWGYGKVDAMGAMRLVRATTGVPAATGPARLSLAPAGASPFRGTASLEVKTLPNAGAARLVIVDVAGRVVARLLDGEQGAGSRRVAWRAQGAVAGIYFARLSAGGESVTRRLVLVP